MNKDDFESLKRGLAQVEAYKAGERAGFTVHESVDVKQVRVATGKSQAEFARTYHIPVGTLRDWEQSRRQPDAPARVLLTLIKREPALVEKIIAAG